MFSRLFLAVSKGDLHQRHYGVIPLLAAFKCQQVVIGAARARRKFATDLRAREIDSALARLRIEKLAGLAEDRIGFSPQNLLAFPGGGETLLGRRKIYTEVIRQAFDVALGNLNALVDRATIRRTLRTVVVISRLIH